MVSSELEARLDNLLSTTQVETVDIDIFAPIPARDECPICLVTLPLSDNYFTFFSCCGKYVCNGCNYKDMVTDMKKAAQHGLKCAFCQQWINDLKSIKSLKKLMKNDHPGAFMEMAFKYKDGNGVLQSDTKAIEMCIRAAELDHNEAYHDIGYYSQEGIMLEQNTAKAMEYYEIAAKKGSVHAHNRLAANLHAKNEVVLCIKHMKLAANAGNKEAMDCLMTVYKENKDKSLSKEELTVTLHAFHASSNQMKSKDRDDARAFNSLI